MLSHAVSAPTSSLSGQNTILTGRFSKSHGMAVQNKKRCKERNAELTCNIINMTLMCRVKHIVVFIYQMILTEACVILLFHCSCHFTLNSDWRQSVR